MSGIDWAKVRKQVEQEVIADKTAEILADADAYECVACCIESQPCDVGLAVKVERNRIIELINRFCEGRHSWGDHCTCSDLVRELKDNK